MSYLVLYPELEDPEGRFERFLRTAFNNVGKPDSFELVPVSLTDTQSQMAALRFVRTFAWGTTGTLILFDDIWHLYAEYVAETIESECSGYRHVVRIPRLTRPLFVLKVDDFQMGFKEICEYVKWLVLEAGFFEVQSNNRGPI